MEVEPEMSWHRQSQRLPKNKKENRAHRQRHAQPDEQAGCTKVAVVAAGDAPERTERTGGGREVIKWYRVSLDCVEQDKVFNNLCCTAAASATAVCVFSSVQIRVRRTCKLDDLRNEKRPAAAGEMTKKFLLTCGLECPTLSAYRPLISPCFPVFLNRLM